MERQRKARGQVSPDKATPPPPIRHEFEVLVRIKFVKRDPQRRSAPESVVVKSALRWLSPFYVEGSGEYTANWRHVIEPAEQPAVEETGKGTDESPADSPEAPR